MTPHPDQNDIDPYETPEYQEFLAECAKHCRCKQRICAGVLAGGMCDNEGWDDEMYLDDDLDRSYYDDEDY